MSCAVESLEPRALWAYFERICQIPHGSGNERALATAVVDWAGQKGCETEVDDTGNVLVRIPAKSGYEEVDGVVLQGHLDMVCEKNSDTEFDFEKESIVLVREDDWIRAAGTSLGADNGIGIAAGLAFMDMPQAIHGPLELLLTVDEESGLIGAQQLSPGVLKGRKLINLDSEQDGVFYIGCAGGRDACVELPLAVAFSSKNDTGYRIQVKGLRGGHSGLDILSNRGNAIRLLARTLHAIGREMKLALTSIESGDKHNAIPREGVAVVTVASGSDEVLREIIERQRTAFSDEFSDQEPDLVLTAERVTLPGNVFDSESTDKVLCLLLGLPNGVLTMDRHIQGVVETSTNIARARIVDGNRLEVLNSIRSPLAVAMDGVAVQIEAVATAVGAKMNQLGGYPGWKPDINSELLAKAQRIWREVHREEASLQVIHAGLECGIIGEKYPDMQMISIGPTIQNPHSPNERVSILSVVRFFDFFQALLASLV